MKILKAMQHQLTEQQKEELALISMGNDDIDVQTDPLEIHDLATIKPDLFTTLCNCPSDPETLKVLALGLSGIAQNFTAVIVPIGSPAFMFEFAQQMKDTNVSMLFSHSERVSKEVTDKDGRVTKTSVFEHQRWIIL